MHLLFTLCLAAFAGAVWGRADPAGPAPPTSWGELKHSHLDDAATLDWSELEQAADYPLAAKPLFFRGTFRGGRSYSIRAEHWLLFYPKSMEPAQSRFNSAALEVGIQRFNFAQDGGRLFEILDELYGKLERFPEEDIPAILVFQLDVVSQAFKWQHTHHPPESPAYMASLRLAVDAWMYEFKNGLRFYRPP